MTNKRKSIYELGRSAFDSAIEIVSPLLKKRKLDTVDEKHIESKYCVWWKESKFVDFSDGNARSSSNPDVSIISMTDKKELHFHLCILLKYDYFKKMFDGSFIERHKIHKHSELHFSYKSINLMLNYMDDKSKFVETLTTEYKNNLDIHDFNNLMQLSDMIGIVELCDIAKRYIVELLKSVNDDMVKYFETHRIDMNILRKGIITGKYAIIEPLSSAFLGDTFDYGIRDHTFLTFKHLLSHYIPSNPQMRSIRIVNARDKYDIYCISKSELYQLIQHYKSMEILPQGFARFSVHILTNLNDRVIY
jgi:hypothetical protein